MCKATLRHLARADKLRPGDLTLMVCALGVYAANRWLLSRCLPGAAGGFCRCYLNDLCAPLFFLPFARTALALADCEVPRCLLVLLGLLAGFVWEFVGPMINPRSVFDPWDLACYAVGTAVYCLFVGRRATK